MSAASHYSITVSQNGKHFFTTDQNTCQHWTHKHAVDMFRMFTAKFPKVDGYEVSLSYWDCSGKPLLSTKDAQ